MSTRRRPTAAFSLFTFLDVMLCTLGALIIVLICVVRTAQIKNSDVPPEAAAEIEEIESARATAQWRAKHLASSRDAMRKQLEDRRLELSHIEEHARGIRAQLADLDSAASAVQADPAHQQRLAALRDEVRRLAERAAATEAELEKTRAEAGAKRPSYAVVPYEGPNHTTRRPLYIECRAEQIILQPENIVLTEIDFDGPLGPGNPLAAGLRAAREHLAQSYSLDAADGGEPYPLLLVRPDGIGAYYVAREAMASWGSEFGYEFIDEDWKLEFRTPQPAMVEAMQLAVDEARVRQRALARAAPRYVAEQSREWYRASSSGGVVRDGSVGGGRDGGTKNGGGGRDRWGAPGGSGGYAQRSGSDRYGEGAYHEFSAGGGRGQRGTGRSRGVGGDDPSRDAQDGNDEDLAAIYGAAAASPPAGATAGTGLGNGPAGAGAIAASGAGDAPAGGAGFAPHSAGGPFGYATSAHPSTAAGNGLGAGANGQAGAGGAAAPGTAAIGAGPNGIGTNADGPSLPGNVTRGSDPRNGSGAGPLVAGPYGAPQPGAANPNGGAGGRNPSTIAAGNRAANTSGNASGSDPATANDESADGASGSGPGSGPGGPQSSGKHARGTVIANAAQSGAAQNAQSASAGGQAAAAGGKAGGRAGQSSGQAASTPAGATPLNVGNSASASQSASGDPSGTPQVGMPSVTVGGPKGSATDSVASRRGKNWSLPEEARHAVPLTRPVRVECRADRLVLRSEQNPSQTREIPMRGQTEESVEDLVAAVWHHVDDWGPAGHGMFWRPVLSVDVAPGANGRFNDLQTLLADSGLEVKPAAKQPAPVARPPRKTGLW